MKVERLIILKIISNTHSLLLYPRKSFFVGGTNPPQVKNLFLSFLFLSKQISTNLMA